MLCSDYPQRYAGLSGEIPFVPLNLAHREASFTMRKISILVRFISLQKSRYVKLAGGKIKSNALPDLRSTGLVC